LEYAAAHGYLDQKTAKQANEFYDEILRMIVAMIHGSSNWCDLTSKGRRKPGSEEKGESGSQGVREKRNDYRYEDEFPLIDQARLLSQTPDLPDSPSPNLPAPNSCTKPEANHA